MVRAIALTLAFVLTFGMTSVQTLADEPQPADYDHVELGYLEDEVYTYVPDYNIVAEEEFIEYEYDEYELLVDEAGEFEQIITTPLTPLGFGRSLSGFAGSGTVDDPFIISTALELEWLAYYVNTGNTNFNDRHYKMSNNISLSTHGAIWNNGRGKAIA